MQGGLTSFASSGKVAELEAELAAKVAEVAKLEEKASDMQVKKTEMRGSLGAGQLGTPRTQGNGDKKRKK